MTELAYMVREDWAGDPPDPAAGSKRVADWLAGRRHLVGVPRPPLGSDERPVDAAAIRWISPAETRTAVRETSCLTHDLPPGGTTAPVLFIHPTPTGDCQTIVDLVRGGLVRSAFVLVWSPMDTIRLWLEAMGAAELSGKPTPDLPDAVLMCAARAVQDEEYDGLDIGRGKDAAVQAIRVLAAEGYPLDPELWGRALLRAGSSLRSAEVVMDYVKSMAAGHRYRTERRFRDDIARVWRAAAIADPVA